MIHRTKGVAECCEKILAGKRDLVVPRSEALRSGARVGCFVELELQANDENLEAAKRTISKLAADLNLGPSERRSYLEMLLEKKA